jgi:peptide/nickel transport system substrate-binding protein
VRAHLAALLIAALTGTAFGCGEDDDVAPQPGGLPAAGGGGALRYSVPRLPADLDPLEAGSRSEQLVSRQVYEPLVGAARAPYGGELSREGLAASITPSSTRAEWTIVLRPGVRFQDGASLDVPALLLNARRWIASPAGDRLLPGAFGADSPRPGAVRLLFTGPVAGVPELLAAPELGLVSPAALEPVGGERLRLRPGSDQAGTGPFEVATRTEGSLDLVRNAGWWGSSAGLGPALDSVAFVEEPVAAERAARLVDGGAQAAEAVGASGLDVIAGDPLVRTEGGPNGIAYVASVRGLEAPPAVPRLSAVWLTNIGE